MKCILINTLSRTFTYSEVLNFLIVYNSITDIKKKVVGTIGKLKICNLDDITVLMLLSWF